MRLFEALTIAFSGQVVFAVAIMTTTRPRWLNLLPLAALVPFAAHLLLEGPRWQMAPAYLVTLTASVLGIIAWRRAGGDPPAPEEAEQKRLLSRAAAFVGILLLAASLVLAATVPGR